jgi:putative addiction module CopG family antidote
VRTALRLLEHQEHQVAALRNAVAVGERSGESETNYWTGTLYLTCDLPWGSVPV